MTNERKKVKVEPLEVELVDGTLRLRVEPMSPRWWWEQGHRIGAEVCAALLPDPYIQKPIGDGLGKYHHRVHELATARGLERDLVPPYNAGDQQWRAGVTRAVEEAWSKAAETFLTGPSHD